MLGLGFRIKIELKCFCRNLEERARGGGKNEKAKRNRTCEFVNGMNEVVEQLQSHFCCGLIGLQ